MVPIIIRPHKYGGKGVEDKLFSVLTLDILCKNNINTQIYLIDIDGRLGKLTSNLQEKYKNLKYYNYEYYTKSDEILKFQENYVHLSSNPIALELNGILSFIYTKKFINDMKLNNFYIIENDVIVNCNLNNLINQLNFKINNNYVYLSNYCVLGVSLCNKEYLEYYLYCVYKCYTTEKIIDSMKNIYNKMQSNGKPGGINDMTFNDWIRNGCHDFDKEKFKIINLNTYSDTIIIDNNIKGKTLKVNNENIEFALKKIEMTNDYKKLYINEHTFYDEQKYYDNAIVYYKAIEIINKKMLLDNREVLITHFGGASKILIPKFYKTLI